MPRKADLTGQKFGLLTALYPLAERKNKCLVWVCRCECGNTVNLPTTDLTLHRVKSCGCLRHRPKDIIGERRGHLTAIDYTDRRDKRGHAIYVWRCDCGNEFEHVIISPTKESNICPECLRKLKAQQVNACRENRHVDPNTGLTDTALSNIIEGKLTKRNSSGVRGVSWHKGKRKWAVSGRENGKPVFLGDYDTLEEAREVRENFVLKHYGFCKT